MRLSARLAPFVMLAFLGACTETALMLDKPVSGVRIELL